MASNKLSRRDTIKLFGAALGGATLANLPAKWNTPRVISGVLPAHAQTSIKACAPDLFTFLRFYAHEDGFSFVITMPDETHHGEKIAYEFVSAKIEFSAPPKGTFTFFDGADAPFSEETFKFKGADPNSFEVTLNITFNGETCQGAYKPTFFIPTPG